VIAARRFMERRFPPRAGPVRPLLPECERWQGGKAAEDSRTPRPRGQSGVRESAPASWSAAVLCRFGRVILVLYGERISWGLMSVATSGINIKRDSSACSFAE